MTNNQEKKATQAETQEEFAASIAKKYDADSMLRKDISKLKEGLLEEEEEKEEKREENKLLAEGERKIRQKFEQMAEKFRAKGFEIKKTSVSEGRFQADLQQEDYTVRFTFNINAWEEDKMNDYLKRLGKQKNSNFYMSGGYCSYLPTTSRDSHEEIDILAGDTWSSLKIDDEFITDLDEMISNGIQDVKEKTAKEVVNRAHQEELASQKPEERLEMVTRAAEALKNSLMGDYAGSPANNFKVLVDFEKPKKDEEGEYTMSANWLIESQDGYSTLVEIKINPNELEPSKDEPEMEIDFFYGSPQGLRADGEDLYNTFAGSSKETLSLASVPKVKDLINDKVSYAKDTRDKRDDLAKENRDACREYYKKVNELFNKIIAQLQSLDLEVKRSSFGKVEFSDGDIHIPACTFQGIKGANKIAGTIKYVHSISADKRDSMPLENSKHITARDSRPITSLEPYFELLLEAVDKDDKHKSDVVYVYEKQVNPYKRDVDHNFKPISIVEVAPLISKFFV